MTSTEDNLKALNGCLVAILLVPFKSFARAFALVHLWHWFVVQPFAARDLNYPLALGLSLTVGLWTYDPGGARNKELTLWKLGLYSIGVSLFALGLGWIYKQLM